MYLGFYWGVCRGYWVCVLGLYELQSKLFEGGVLGVRGLGV